MPLLIGLLALFMPRLVVALLFLFTQRFYGIFDSLLWLILGFIFLSTALLKVEDRNDSSDCRRWVWFAMRDA